MGPLPWLLGLLVLLAYLFTGGPSFFWLDSSEFVAAAWGLGVAHPPGHPLPSLLGRLICLLPVGTIAFRVTLASALQAAGATALMASLSFEVLRRVRRTGALKACPPWALGAAASVAALVLGLSYALWFQAVRAEVYALNLLLIVAGVYLVLRWEARGDRRFLLGAGLCCGLALCNHHFLLILCLPAVGLFVVLRRPSRPKVARSAVGLALAVLLGLATLAYLPLRAARAPQANWGSPTTPDRFAWVVSAKTFHKSMDHAATESVSHRGVGGVFSVARGMLWDSILGPLVGIIALLGHYLIWRRRQTWRIGLLLTGIALANLASPLTVGLDPLNPDAYGYLAVAVAFLCPGIAVVIAAVAGAVAGTGGRRRGNVAAVAVCCVAGLVPLYQVHLNLPRADLSRHWSAEESARQLMRQQPPGALLLTSHFETIFNLWALRVASDLRPDVEVVHRNFLQHEGYLQQLAARHEALLPMARRWKAAGHLSTDDLDRLAAQGPLRLEYDLNLPRPVVRHLEPAGLAQAYRRTGDSSWSPRVVATHLAAMERWQRAVLPGAGEALDNQTRRAVVWTNYLVARFACHRGGPAKLVRHHLRAALALAPSDRLLLELQRRCLPPTQIWRKRP
jgi:hypothetical protein